MTKKQKQEAIAFMYEKGVELVCAPFGVHNCTGCAMCHFNALGKCPMINDDLMCRQIAGKDFLTFFREII